LIDSKKCVDSISYIGAHVDELSYLNLRDKVEEKLKTFYLNLRLVYSTVLSKTERANLAKSDAVFKETMYEADKNYAHKDESYVHQNIASFDSLIKCLKTRLIHCKDVCKNGLPSIITLDFVVHDPALFRLVNKIDKDDEKAIMKMFHPNYGEPVKGTPMKSIRVFNDTEDIKAVKDPLDFGTILSAGITQCETLQNMQDFAIRTNVLYKTDIWPSVNADGDREMKQFLDSIGLGKFY